jgi:hypothetical protein
LPLAVSISILFAASSAATASILTATGVDSALGGTMSFTGYVPNFNNGTFTLTAQNTSATTTYHGVDLAIEFIYPSTVNSPTQPIANGFSYSGGGLWSGPGGAQQLKFTGVSSPYTFSMQLLDPSQISVPLSDSLGGFTAGPLLTTDSIPLIQLGDFGPGVSKSFTLTATEPAGAVFPFVSDSFFVAAPEPSSFVLAGLGAALAVAAIRRHRAGSH